MSEPYRIKPEQMEPDSLCLRCPFYYRDEGSCTHDSRYLVMEKKVVCAGFPKELMPKK